MPTTDYLLTVMRMKGAQDMARDLATVGDKYQELSARAEAEAASCSTRPLRPTRRRRSWRPLETLRASAQSGRKRHSAE